jgi:uncharacterized protein (TIGR02147 family)
MPSIYNYIDYRKYLFDYIKEKKTQRNSFSFRQLALKCNLSTSNYIQKIITNEKNMGIDLILRISKALNLNKKESDYFYNLVLFNQTKNNQHKLEYFKILESLRNDNKLFNRVNFITINKKWYYPVIWELISCENFNTTIENIVESLNNKITKKQAKDAIKFLRDNNLIKIANSKYVQNNLQITAPDEVKNLLLQEFHKIMLIKATEAIEQPISEREFQGLTVAISENKFKELKQRIKEFTFELHKSLSNDSEANKVYQININAFVVAKTKN